MTIRFERMMSSVPAYYQQSAIFQAIQQAQSDEFENVEAKNIDLQNQLYIVTATWGLRYWETLLNIPVILTDTYEIRRSRVLSKWRGLSSQFSSKMIKSICEAYSNGEVDVTIDMNSQKVIITFIGTKGIPPNMPDLDMSIGNIIHAHLGYEFVYLFNLYSQLKAFTYGTLGGYTSYEMRNGNIMNQFMHESLESFTHQRLEGILNGS